MTNKSKILFPIFLIIFFTGWTLFFYFFSPEEFIAFLGVENSYLLMFILAMIGGMTTFSGIPYHAVLIILASGGLNAPLLGLVTSLGVITGDATSYYIGYKGAQIIPGAILKRFKRVHSFSVKHPKFLPLAFFLYGALVPLSNDFIVISMGLTHYPFWRVMIPLGLGNLFFNTSVALLSVYAFDFVKNVL